MIKGVSETVENEINKQEGGILGIKAATSVSTILVIMLAGKSRAPGRGVVEAGNRTIRVGERKNRAGQNF